MWIICQADNSHDMSNLICLWKIIQKNLECPLLQFCLTLYGLILHIMFWKVIEMPSCNRRCFWEEKSKTWLFCHYGSSKWDQFLWRISKKQKKKKISFGPGHGKTCLRAYGDSEGQDKPAHLHNLVRAFPVFWQNHRILQFVWMDSKGLGPVFQN